MLQALGVLNHAGITVSYSTAWRYLNKLISDAKFTDRIHSGRMLWAYDNLNIHKSVRHERKGTCNTYSTCTVHVYSLQYHAVHTQVHLSFPVFQISTIACSMSHHVSQLGYRIYLIGMLIGQTHNHSVPVSLSISPTSCRV